jgi:DNA-binding CsgD family transcriptional regulator
MAVREKLRGGWSFIGDWPCFEWPESLGVAPLIFRRIDPSGGRHDVLLLRHSLSSAPEFFALELCHEGACDGRNPWDTLSARLADLFAVLETLEQMPSLTDRQHACLALVAQGLRSEDVASRLAISVSAVEQHLQAARRRLGARSRAHGVAIAVRLGLLRTQTDAPVVDRVRQVSFIDPQREPDNRGGQERP